MAAISVAPTVGFWIYNRGWLQLCLVGAALNLVMLVIASMLEEHRLEPAEKKAKGGLLEWRVLVISGPQEADDGSPCERGCFAAGRLDQHFRGALHVARQ